MRKIVVQIILSILCFTAQAQKVSNIRAEQRGQDIVVLYTLETTSQCEVSLILSQDNGSSWGTALKNVSGDVGKNISAGEKQITWKVLEEQESLIGDKMKFKVITNGRKSFEPEMVFVEGGAFQMGSEAGNLNEKPVHEVSLSSFYIGKYEITQSQWKAVMGVGLSDMVEGEIAECQHCPMVIVSWDQAQEFISKLNIQTGKNYRLPTEAEWEFAAKGGVNGEGFEYSGSDELNSVAWCPENSLGVLHEVGGKKPNELGIYDMSGNVWEWCSDWFGKYNSYVQINPVGPASGSPRVMRGGSWDCQTSFENRCRVATRQRLPPDAMSEDIGFRLVLPTVR
jgi:formylglycine-generating enzyme required for sulfatase activity